MSDDINSKSAGMIEWIHDLPDWVKSVFAIIIAIMLLLPMAAATGADERFFPNRDLSFIREDLNAIRKENSDKSSLIQETMLEINSKVTSIDIALRTQSKRIDDLNTKYERLSNEYDLLSRKFLQFEIIMQERFSDIQEFEEKIENFFQKRKTTLPRERPAP